MAIGLFYKGKNYASIEDDKIVFLNQDADLNPYLEQFTTIRSVPDELGDDDLIEVPLSLDLKLLKLVGLGFEVRDDSKQVKKAIPPKLREELSTLVAQAMKKLKVERVGRLTPQQLQMVTDEISVSLAGRGYEAIRGKMRGMFRAEVEKVERELNKNIIFGEREGMILSRLASNAKLLEAVRGVNERSRAKLAEKLIRNYSSGDFSIDAMVEDLRDEIDGTEADLERIARTESSRIANVARLESYAASDPLNEFRYEWIGPDDDRTTDRCKAIMRRTRKGVSKQELLAIISEESRKFDPKWDFDPENPVAGYSCRHVLVRATK